MKSVIALLLNKNLRNTVESHSYPFSKFIDFFLFIIVAFALVGIDFANDAILLAMFAVLIFTISIIQLLRRILV